MHDHNRAFLLQIRALSSDFWKSPLSQSIANILQPYYYDYIDHALPSLAKPLLSTYSISDVIYMRNVNWILLFFCSLSLLQSDWL